MDKSKIRKTINNRTLQNRINKILKEDDNPDEVMERIEDENQETDITKENIGEEKPDEKEFSENLKTLIADALSTVGSLKTEFAKNEDDIKKFDNTISKLTSIQNAIIEKFT